MAQAHKGKGKGGGQFMKATPTPAKAPTSSDIPVTVPAVPERTHLVPVERSRSTLYLLAHAGSLAKNADWQAHLILNNPYQGADGKKFGFPYTASDLVYHPSRNVRLAVATSELAPQEWLTDLSYDKDVEVASAARETLKNTIENKKAIAEWMSGLTSELYVEYVDAHQHAYEAWQDRAEKGNDERWTVVGAWQQATWGPDNFWN